MLPNAFDISSKTTRDTFFSSIFFRISSVKWRRAVSVFRMKLPVATLLLCNFTVIVQVIYKLLVC